MLHFPQCQPTHRHRLRLRSAHRSKRQNDIFKNNNNCAAGSFLFNTEAQVVLYMPRPQDLSPGGKKMTAAVIAPFSEGVYIGNAVANVTFES